jgi:hypothetical protein
MRSDQQQEARGVITMAFAKPRYVEMAKSFARSLHLHAPDIPRAILTDATDPELSTLFTHVIPYKKEFGANMAPKFYLDRYSPFAETLYVDSDCLALGNLDAMWKAFASQYFGVPGWRVLRKGDTDPYVDVAYVLDRFGLDGLPKFNGGTYYFRRSKEATQFFDTARSLLGQAQALRIGSFRDLGLNDEPIFALTMALHGLQLTYMGTGGMWTPIGMRGPLRLDVIKGTCSFEKEGRILYPEIVHFAGEYGAAFAYARECARLRAHFTGERLPVLPLFGAWLKSIRWQCSRQIRTSIKTMVNRGTSRRRTTITN